MDHLFPDGLQWFFPEAWVSTWGGGAKWLIQHLLFEYLALLSTILFCCWDQGSILWANYMYAKSVWLAPELFSISSLDYSWYLQWILGKIDHQFDQSVFGVKGKSSSRFNDWYMRGLEINSASAPVLKVLSSVFHPSHLHCPILYSQPVLIILYGGFKYHTTPSFAVDWVILSWSNLSTTSKNSLSAATKFVPLLDDIPLGSPLRLTIW